MAHQRSAQVWTNPDERSAGFFALGAAKALRQPVAAICTSGTAAANYYPAVIEAHYSRSPLVILTADRPPRVRGRGAPQTIDQIELYSRYPVYFADLPLPDVGDPTGLPWRLPAKQACDAAIGPPAGPVHLNVPFDEPFFPDPDGVEHLLSALRDDELPDRVPVARRESDADDATWQAAAGKLAQSRRPLIVCGPQDFSDHLADGVTRLGAVLSAPILADIASQVRCNGATTENVISHYDIYLRDQSIADALCPDVVLRLGGLPTSKMLNEWLAAQIDTEQIAVSADGEITDPYGTISLRVHADPEIICRRLFEVLRQSQSRNSDYLTRWRTVDICAEKTWSKLTEVGDTEIFEGSIVASVFSESTDGTAIYLSNSMPIRWADGYAGARKIPMRVLCNRGANGIDGIVSSAAGAAWAFPDRPVVLVIGDIAFGHDLNGLWKVAEMNRRLKIVLLNNDGGGIFSFLPIAGHANVFERLVAMPHGQDLSLAAGLHGIRHCRVESLDDFRQTFSSCLSREGPEIIEVVTNRDRTVQLHQEIGRRIQERIATEALFQTS